MELQLPLNILPRRKADRFVQYYSYKGRTVFWDGKRLKCEHKRIRRTCKDCSNNTTNNTTNSNFEAETEEKLFHKFMLRVTRMEGLLNLLGRDIFDIDKLCSIIQDILTNYNMDKFICSQLFTYLIMKGMCSQQRGVCMKNIREIIEDIKVLKVVFQLSNKCGDTIDRLENTGPL